MAYLKRVKLCGFAMNIWKIFPDSGAFSNAIHRVSAPAIPGSQAIHTS